MCSESLSQCITLVLGLFCRNFPYFFSPESPHYFSVYIFRRYQLSKCWRQTKTKELPGSTVWLLINSSSLGLFLCCMVGNPSTFIQEWLKNKTTTTNNEENLQFFGSWQSIWISCLLFFAKKSLLIPMSNRGLFCSQY